MPNMLLEISGEITPKRMEPVMGVTGDGSQVQFTVHVLLKPGLENVEHYFTSV